MKGIGNWESLGIDIDEPVFWHRFVQKIPMPDARFRHVAASNHMMPKAVHATAPHDVARLIASNRLDFVNDLIASAYMDRQPLVLDWSLPESLPVIVDRMSAYRPFTHGYILILGECLYEEKLATDEGFKRHLQPVQGERGYRGRFKNIDIYTSSQQEAAWRNMIVGIGAIPYQVTQYLKLDNYFPLAHFVWRAGDLVRHREDRELYNWLATEAVYYVSDAATDCIQTFLVKDEEGV